MKNEEKIQNEEKIKNEGKKKFPRQSGTIQVS